MAYCTGELTHCTEPLPPKIQKALSLLLSSTKKVRLDELSARVGLSKYYLSRLFHRHIGQAPCRFQTLLRLARAEALLRAGGRAVDIAYAVGYADQSHMCRVFRAAIGLSPRQYAAAQQYRSTPPSTRSHTERNTIRSRKKQSRGLVGKHW